METKKYVQAKYPCPYCDLTRKTRADYNWHLMVSHFEKWRKEVNKKKEKIKCA